MDRQLYIFLISHKMPVTGATGIPPTASYLPESKVGKPKLASSQLPVTLKIFYFSWIFSFLPP